jgi:hypothetical protein
LIIRRGDIDVHQRTTVTAWVKGDNQAHSGTLTVLFSGTAISQSGSVASRKIALVPA